MISERTTATTSFLLRQAEYAHDMGLCPIPMQAGTKKPAIIYSHVIDKGNRPSLETLRDWWRRNPDWNVGLLLGSNSGGVMALDFDDRNDYRSWAGTKPELAAWLPTVQTRDGFHVYFQTTEKFTASHDLRSHGLSGELKGDGTLTVFPGSIVDGHTYSWVIQPEPTGIPPVCLATSGLVPESFLSTIHNFTQTATQKTKRNRSKSQKSKNTVNNGKSQEGTQSVTQSVPQSVPQSPPPNTKQTQFSVFDFAIQRQGQRNNTLLKLAAALGNEAGPQGVDPDEASRWHDDWFNQFGELCSTDRETSELEFLDMLDRYRGDTFLWRLTQALPAAPMPNWAKVVFPAKSSSKARELCRLLVCADKLNDGGTFYLSFRKMAELVDFAEASAADRVVKRLKRKEILTIPERGNRTKANVYRLLVDCDGRIREHQKA